MKHHGHHLGVTYSKAFKRKIQPSKQLYVNTYATGLKPGRVTRVKRVRSGL